MQQKNQKWSRTRLGEILDLLDITDGSPEGYGDQDCAEIYCQLKNFALTYRVATAW